MFVVIDDGMVDRDQIIEYIEMRTPNELKKKSNRMKGKKPLINISIAIHKTSFSFTFTFTLNVNIFQLAFDVFIRSLYA